VPDSQFDFLFSFTKVIEEIKTKYLSYGFVIERDFVWTVQKHLQKMINEQHLPCTIFNDYPIESGTHRSVSVDLAVVNNEIHYMDILQGKSKAEFVAEFKFEPSELRPDICSHKLPVVFWNHVNNDIIRIKRFVDDRKTKSAVAIFIDENGRYRNKVIGNLSKWIDWGSYDTDRINVSVLWTSLR